MANITLIEALTHITLSVNKKEEHCLRFDSEDAALAVYQYVRSLSIPAEMEPAGASDTLVTFKIRRHEKTKP